MARRLSEPTSIAYRPSRPLLAGLFALALVVKMCFALIHYLGYVPTGPYGDLTQTQGDTQTYLEPIDHLIEQHSYDPDLRLPGYGAVYAFFRLLLDKGPASDEVVVIQHVADAFSVLLLALAALELTGSKRVFQVVFWCYLLSPSVSLYARSLLSESFTCFALIAELYFFLRFFRLRFQRDLLCAGIFLGWAVFMRPIYVLLLPLQLLWLLRATRAPISKWLRYACFFCAPFAIADTVWVVRNVSVHHRFIPLSNGFVHPSLLNSPIWPVKQFVQAFGGSLVWWEPDAEVRWFGVDGGGPSSEHVELPPWVATSVAPMDSLAAVALDVRIWLADTAGTPQRRAIGASIEERMVRYRAAFIREHPWRYMVHAPLRSTWFHLKWNGMVGLNTVPFAQAPWAQRLLKVWGSALFVVLQYAGVLASLLGLLMRNVRSRLGWFSATVLILILIHPMVLRMSEHRYMIPMFPWLIVLAVAVGSTLISRQWEHGAGTVDAS